MLKSKKPKVILFDMGGVCVLSPFQVILDYESNHGIPPGWVNYSISKTAPNGFWHRLEKGLIPLDREFYDGFTKDLSDMDRWNTFYTLQHARDSRLPVQVPPVPDIDGEQLFEEMMTKSASPDPWMFPALKALRANGRYILGALSNTVIFPPSHALAWKKARDDPVRSLFDFFVSSAHVGMRKPEPRVYQLALQTANEFALLHKESERGRVSGWSSGIAANEVVFLDDIGENLKAARREGFQTLKVPLGRAYEAVHKLEQITGLKLAGCHPKMPAGPIFDTPKAKI